MASIYIQASFVQLSIDHNYIYTFHFMAFSSQVISTYCPILYHLSSIIYGLS